MPDATAESASWRADEVPNPLGRPLVPAALALALGIWAAESLHDADAPRLVALAGLFGLAAAGFLARRGPVPGPWWKAPWARCLPVGLALLLADLRVSAGLAIADDRIDRTARDGDEVVVEGRIVEEVLREVRIPAEVDYDGRPFFGRVESTSRTALEVETRADRGASASGRLTVYSSDALPDWPVGSRIRIRGRILLPRGPRNPDGPDRALWARRRGEAGVLHARADGAEALPGEPEVSLASLAGSLRRALRDRLVHACGFEGSRLARGIVLGERAALTDAQARDFLRSGTVHFLAVSGLNVALVAGAASWLAGLFGARRAGRGGAALAAAGAYAAVTGLAPPVVRAGLMVAVWLGADLIGRRRDGPSTIAAAAIGVLAADPFALFDPGFQLSFISVAAIGASGLFAPRLPVEDAPGKPATTGRIAARGLLTALRVSLAAWIGVLPLVMVHFHRVSGYAVPASILLGPLVALLLVSGLALALSGSGWLAFLVTLPSRIVEDLARGFGALPGALWPLPIPGPAALALYYLALGGFAEARRTGRRSPAWAGLVSAGACVLAWAGPGPEPLPGGFRVTAFDVGHGTMVLVEVPGRTLLYDAGGSSGAAQARWVLEPYACRRRIRGIDSLVLSHADMDHVAAVPALIDTFEIGEVVVSARFAISPLGKEVLLQVDRAGIPVRVVAAGDAVALGDGAAAEVLWPPGQGEAPAGLSDNDGSIVLRLAIAGRAIWLTGDVERGGWDRFLAANPTPPGCDALLAPHHGSAGAWHAALARLLRPSWVAISAGERVPWGETAAAWRELGAAVKATPECGAVIFEGDGHGGMTMRGHAER